MLTEFYIRLILHTKYNCNYRSANILLAFCFLAAISSQPVARAESAQPCGLCASSPVQQHGDLEARLQNAQNAERHLEKLAKDHPGMAAPLSQLQQQQLAQLRGEIDRLRAERQTYDSRAVFSNIYFSLREERLAPVESFGAQLRSSAVNGFSDVLRVLSAMLLFCVNYGPSLLLWAAILFFPARFLWRRSRPALQQNPA